MRCKIRFEETYGKSKKKMNEKKDNREVL